MSRTPLGPSGTGIISLMQGEATGTERRRVRLWRYGANATFVESTEEIMAKWLRQASGCALDGRDRTYPLLS